MADDHVVVQSEGMHPRLATKKLLLEFRGHLSLYEHAATLPLATKNAGE
jgi:hypothetical protein